MKSAIFGFGMLAILIAVAIVMGLNEQMPHEQKPKLRFVSFGEGAPPKTIIAVDEKTNCYYRILAIDSSLFPLITEEDFYYNTETGELDISRFYYKYNEVKDIMFPVTTDSGERYCEMGNSTGDYSNHAHQ